MFLFEKKIYILFKNVFVYFYLKKFDKNLQLENKNYIQSL
jgi:hypothetical protein